MLKIKDILQLENKKLVNFDEVKIKNFKGVSIDSREVKPGELFIAIKGENTDGHKYVKDVFKKGVKVSLVSESWFRKNKNNFSAATFLNALIVALF